MTEVFGYHTGSRGLWLESSGTGRASEVPDWNLEHLNSYEQNKGTLLLEIFKCEKKCLYFLDLRSNKHSLSKYFIINYHKL